jgi:hypothetical protein
MLRQERVGMAGSAVILRSLKRFGVAYLVILTGLCTLGALLAGIAGGAVGRGR